MPVKMTAKTNFTNPRIAGPNSDGSVSPGDAFTTDWLHAKELDRLGLAKADEPQDLQREPTDPVEPHNQISVVEHAKVNDRRATARGEADKPAPDKPAPNKPKA